MICSDSKSASNDLQAGRNASIGEAILTCYAVPLPRGRAAHDEPLRVLVFR